MTIVATTDTRNSQWANDSSSFGRKMLAKMGWKGDGAGLGKNQQGSSNHLRAVRRAESLGIGAENDAFGDKGWNDTNAGFHGVLASLKKEYSSVGGSGSGNNSEEEEEDVAAKKRRRKEEKRRKRKEEKRRAKNGGGAAGTDGGGGDRVRLPQNKVQAGHARKMREAKDIRNKSAEDMAAIFGVKADFYKQPREWGASAGSSGDGGADVTDALKDAAGDEEEKKKEKKLKKRKGGESNEGDACGDCIENGELMKDKKKKKRTRSSEEGGVSSDSEDRKKKKKSKKDKSKQ